MKNWYLLINLLLCVDCIFAQKINNVIGPSPEAAGFAKYGDIPVSTYTGIPSISIPLYTIENSDLKIPVNLSYHAGGFRVDEEAGRAGLGWVVNAGGIISRSVNGEDDFLPTRGYLNNAMPEFFDSQVTATLRSGSNLIASSSAGSYIANIVGHQVDMTSFLPYPDAPHPLPYDLEPDVFTYNFNGISGKFTIKKNKEIIKQNPDAIDIKLLNNDGTSWQITTSDGVRYLFDKTEKCRFQSVPGVYSYYTTAWYLTKVISPRGAEVTFNYTETELSSIVSYNNLNEKYILEVIPLDGGTNLRPSAGTKTTSYPPVKSYNPIMLSSIVFPHGSMMFEYEDRVDLTGDKRLSRIKINNAFNSEASFHYDLVQEYFSATSTSYTIPDPGTLDQNIFNKRLKLASLVKRNSVNNVEQIHQFSYSEQDLPSKKSFSRDDWGFYNGAPNSTLLPKQLYRSYLNPSLTVSYPGGANRNASAWHSGAFILKEIKYPTGGKTTFSFEANDYDVANSVNGSSSVPSTRLVDTTLRFFTRRGLDQTFQVTFPTLLTGSNIKFTISSQNGQATSYPYPYYQDAFFEIYSSSNLSTPVVRSWLGDESFWVNQGNYKYVREDQFSLPAGNYVIKTHVASNVVFLNYIDFSFNFKYYKDLSTPHQTAIGGGLRIAKISNLDIAGNEVYTRNFSYHYNFDYDGDGIAEKCSYGRRLASTSYTSSERVVMCGNDSFGNLVSVASQSFNLYSQSGIPNTEIIVGYDRVIVWEGTSKTNGYTEYDYSNNVSIQTPYIQSGFDSRPAGIPNLVSLDNGSLLKQTDYLFTNNSFRKLREVINSYSSTPVITQVGLRMVPTSFSACTAAPGVGMLIAQYPAFQSSWIRLTSQTINTYSDLTNFTSAKTEYQYEGDSPKHYLPRITTTTNSQGKKISKIALYPTDYSNTSGFIKDLKISNILSNPIEQAIFMEDSDGVKVIAGEVTMYKPGGKGLVDRQYKLETSALIPQASFKFSNSPIGQQPAVGASGVFEMDSKYKDEVSFAQYDEIGNPLLIVRRDSLFTSYSWAYNSQYPIAQVENVVPGEFFTTSFEESGAVGLSHTGSKAFTGNFTTADKVSPGLHGKSYILSYWYLSDGQWRFSGELVYTGQVLNGTLDDIRIYPKSARMTTCTYIPGIGISSVTDQKGETDYYEYDDFQRLRSIRDQKGNIRKAYEYNYQFK